MSWDRRGAGSHWRNGQTSGYDWIRRSTRLAIYLRDHCACVRCGSRENLSLGHLDPDGPNTPENLVTMCLPCNGEMRDKTPETFDRDFAERARAAVLVPIDREAGRAWAEKLWPGRFARERAYDRERARRRKQRRAIAA